MAERSDKEELFERMPIPKAVASLALPAIAACIVMILYNLADTFFVGQLNDPLETSAVTLAAPVILAFNAVTNLFGTGCASRMSRSLGVKDYDAVKKSASLGIYGTVICGILFSITSVVFKGGLLNLIGADAANSAQTSAYMLWTVTFGAVPAMLNITLGNLVRAEGRAVHASVGTMSGCILNIILDPFFIMPWGLNMGAAGAGLATCLANCAACLYFFIALYTVRDKTFVTFRPCYFVFDKILWKDIFSVGIPTSIQNLLNVTGMTILNNFMAVYGSEAVSAMGITHKISLLPLYVSMGVSQGIMSLVGYNYASGNRKRMKEAIRFTEFTAGGFMVVSTVVFTLFAGPIISMFMKNALTVEYGSKFLFGASLAMPFLFFDFMAVGMFVACGNGKLAFIFAILRKVVFEIPALFILNKIFPMYGLAYAQLVSEVVLCVAGVVMMERMIKDGAGGPV